MVPVGRCHALGAVGPVLQLVPCALGPPALCCCPEGASVGAERHPVGSRRRGGEMFVNPHWLCNIVLASFESFVIITTGYTEASYGASAFVMLTVSFVPSQIPYHCIFHKQIQCTFKKNSETVSYLGRLREKNRNLRVLDHVIL